MERDPLRLGRRLIHHAELLLELAVAVGAESAAFADPLAGVARVALLVGAAGADVDRRPAGLLGGIRRKAGLNTHSVTYSSMYLEVVGGATCRRVPAGGGG